jgi:hypothetical protein
MKRHGVASRREVCNQLVDTRNCMWKIKAVYPKTPKKFLVFRIIC